MKTSRLAVLAVSAFCASAVHAEYKCSSPETWVDRQACAAAAKGPEELRRFVQSMTSIRINVRAADYVNDATFQVWERRALAEQQRERDETSKKVVARGN